MVTLSRFTRMRAYIALAAEIKAGSWKSSSHGVADKIHLAAPSVWMVGWLNGRCPTAVDGRVAVRQHRCCLLRTPGPFPWKKAKVKPCLFNMDAAVVLRKR